MYPLCHHPHCGKGDFAVGWPTPGGFSPHPQPDTHPSHSSQMGISPLPHCTFCSWKGLGTVALPRALAHPPVQILLAGAVDAAGVMLQPWHRSREGTSSDISVSKMVSRSPCSSSGAGTKPGPRCAGQRTPVLSALGSCYLLICVWAEQNPHQGLSHTHWGSQRHKTSDSADNSNNAIPP